MSETRLCKKIILDNLNEIPFKDDLVQPHPRTLNLNYDAFITSIRTEENAKIDIATVVGGTHPRYVGNTWFECLNNLRTQATIDNLNCNEIRPSILYYTDIEYRNNSCRDPWTIDVINGISFITQGHHRSIISKFLSSVDLIQKEQFGLDSVNYIEHNEKYFRHYCKLEKFINSLPIAILEEISVKVKRRLLEKNENIEKFETIYSLFVGYYDDNIDASNNQQVFAHYQSFNEFRTNLFKQIKYYKKTKKIQLIIKSIQSYLHDNFRRKKIESGVM